MKNIEKQREVIGNLHRACVEMGHGFDMMLLKAEMTPDDWGQAVAALSETLAVARVQWSEAVAERTAQSLGLDVQEYAVQLLDPTGMPGGGASYRASDDDAAADEARELAREFDWVRRVRLLHKASGRSWTVEI